MGVPCGLGDYKSLGYRLQRLNMLGPVVRSVGLLYILDFHQETALEVKDQEPAPHATINKCLS